jgi:hypothetical protein
MEPLSFLYSLIRCHIIETGYMTPYLMGMKLTYGATLFILYFYT